MIPKYAPGDKIPGTPYIVSYTIGRGGGGSVLAVRDEHLDVLRAIKLLEIEPRTGEKREDAIKSLLKEAVVIAKLHKACREHIVEVLFVGQTADSHAVPYIVMELIDGAPLRDLLKRRGGRLEPVHARQVGIDVLAALAAAHDQGVVHRDLKPANIMCEVLDQNRVRMKVIDFGIAGGVNQRTKRIAGTFRYAAPEQIHIQGPSPLMAQTDLYSLGCILYECLAGQGPFDSYCKTNEQYVHAHLTADAPPISTLVPGIPRAFDEFFASILAKEPQARPASARACAAQLMDLPWGQPGDLDVTRTEEMLEAAIQSVVRSHEEKRGVGTPSQRASTSPAVPATMQSPGAPVHVPSHAAQTRPAPGAPSTLPENSAAPHSAKGGTLRVSQVPPMPPGTLLMSEGPATRTSAPLVQRPTPKTNTTPISNPDGPVPPSYPEAEAGFWGQSAQAPHDMDGRDPSTFGAVAQTHRISPSARWIAGGAAAVSAAVLFIALGVWLAHHRESENVSAASNAPAETRANVEGAIAPTASAAPLASASEPTAAPSSSAGAPSASAATSAAPTAAPPDLTKSAVQTHSHSPAHPSDSATGSDTSNTAKTRKLPGSGL